MGNNFKYALDKKDILSIDEFNRINKARQQIVEANKSAGILPSAKTVFKFVKNKINKIDEEPVKLTNTTDIYFNEILIPIIKRIDNNALIYKYPNIFPIYGEVSPSYIYDDKNKEDLSDINYGSLIAQFKQSELNESFPYIIDNKLGDFLYQKGIIPKSDNFKIELCIDTLTNNDECIYLINGEGTYIEQKDNSPLKDTFISFQGPIFAVKINNNINTDISLYTTRINAYNHREIDRYVKANNVINEEVTDFDKNFIIFSDDKISTEQLINGQVKEKLLKIKSEYNNFGIYIHNNYMIIGLNINNTYLTKFNKEYIDPNDYLHSIYKIIEIAYKFKDIMEYGKINEI